MKYAITIFITAFITYLITVKYTYSPKRHVEKLWEEILSMAMKIGEYKKKKEEVPKYLEDFVEDETNKREALIHLLLDYYFSSETDEYFVSQNRPKWKTQPKTPYFKKSFF